MAFTALLLVLVIPPASKGFTVFDITTQARVALRATALAASLALAAPALAGPTPYELTTLVTDLPVVDVFHADLVNPWGIAFNPNGTA